ncbi:MAG: Sec-independent protein translocase protein TatB [Methyloceanibacter sp.]
MLDIGWSELLMVAVVAVVVVGPKELPKLMRTFGFYAGKLRRAASDFQRQFKEAMVESEVEEVRKNIEAIQGSLGDQPLMMPQTGSLQNALGEPIQGESMEALQAEAHQSAKRKEPRAKTSGNKTVPKTRPRAKVPAAKTPAAKTPRAKRATAKPRKAKVVAKPPAKRPAKAPTRARRKP